jgi:hypothetical protein
MRRWNHNIKSAALLQPPRQSRGTPHAFSVVRRLPTVALLLRWRPSEQATSMPAVEDAVTQGDYADRGA